MKRDLKQEAIAHWQNDLAKFAPSKKEPTGVEIAMFEAGYALAAQEQAQADLEPLRVENERLHEKLVNAIVDHPTYELSKRLEAENQRLREALMIIKDSDSYRLSRAVAKHALEESENANNG